MKKCDSVKKEYMLSTQSSEMQIGQEDAGEDTNTVLNTDSQFSNTRISASAPGKINLVLHVGSPGSDGYHPLESIFLAVDLRETVHAMPAEPGTISITYRDLGYRYPDTTELATDEANLAYRAAKILREYTECKAGVHLEIEKRIPIAGGMAGGSADAAATLVAVNKIWNLNLGTETLLRIGASLGADVPFCILGGCAHGVNRGDVLKPLGNIAKQTWVVAVIPQLISTPTVFKHFDELIPEVKTKLIPKPLPAQIIPALTSGNIEILRECISNDLASPALAIVPQIGEVLDILKRAGAITVTVSGSGPTCIGIVRDKKHADELVRATNTTFRRLGVTLHVLQGPVPGAQLL